MTIPQTLQARWQARLEQEPERRAMAFYDAQGNFSWYTFEQFYQRASGYASQLADNGLGRGGGCLLVLQSTEFSATLLFATLLMGAIPLLIAPPALQAKAAFSGLLQIIDRIISKTRPQVVVCPQSMRQYQEQLKKGRRKVRFLFGPEHFSPEAPAHFSMAQPEKTDLAAMQLTSGTTGFPRVCAWKQESVLAALDGMKVAMRLGREDVCLNWTPLYHDMGLVNNFFLCMTHRVPLVMQKPIDFVKNPAIWLRGLSDTGATVTWSPNFGFAITTQRAKDSDLEGVRLNHVRGYWNAAERVHYDTMQAFHQRFAHLGVPFKALKSNFGCAENIGGATFSDVEGPLSVEHIDAKLQQEKRIARPVEPGSDVKSIAVVGVGRPYPGMRIQILSPRGKPLPEGHIGEIGLETPSRMFGYLKDARATRRALFGKLLRTGDLGYLRDGELFWVGRARNRINVRGQKLDPSDFEPILLHVPGLRHGCYAAFGVDDPAQGTQRIVILSEVRDAAGRTSQEICGEIRNQIFLRLGVNVDDVVLVKANTLTKTSSGKRRHRYFRRLYLDGQLENLVWQPDKAAVSNS